MTTRLTLPEAAAELRKTPRWLRDWVRAHPRDNAGEPYYTPVGRDKIFHRSDIARILEEVNRQADYGKTTMTFLYFVEVQGHIKIGIARDWKKRLFGLQVGSPFPVRRLLIVRDDPKTEHKLHLRFAAHHVRGEWFRDCPDIRAYMAAEAGSTRFVIGEDE